MLKRIVVGLLSLSVVGASGAAIASQVTSAAEQPAAVATPVVSAGTAAPLAQGSLGDPWWALGEIIAVDDFGFTLGAQDGEYYVELGPPAYWQAQGVELSPGQQVTVVGTVNEGMYHAAQVQLQDGQVLQVRSELGQPLWSGGVDAGRGGATGSADGQHIPDPQAAVDEWLTVEGTLMAYQNGSMTIETPAGELLSFQSGQPRFFAAQGVTFQVGDVLSVVGFYGEGGLFVAGEVMQLESGLRVMLRDPNGRPLWAGSSNNGNGNGFGSSQGGL